MRKPVVRHLLTALSATTLAFGVVACGASNSDDTRAAGEDEGALVIYSGRNEKLVGPLLDQLRKAVGQKVEIRYGDSSELAAQLLEEGDRTNADLFFSQDAGALGALAKKGMLGVLDPASVALAPDRYHAKDGSWVGVSARSRVLAYNPGKVPAAELPQSIYELTDPIWKGKIGYAPTNASFHAFVTGMRVSAGEEKTRKWLTGFKNNEPKAFDKNGLVLDAVDKGTVSVGLLNHYYLSEKIAELGKSNVTARNHYFPGADPGALVNVAGVGVLKGTDQSAAAAKAVQFLLSAPAQQYFADTTAEYPVVKGITTDKHELPALSALQGPDIDLTQLDSLEQTLALLDEVGLT